MPDKLHALAFSTAVLLLLAQTAAGMTGLGITDPLAYHPPNRSLEIDADVRHDEFIPRDSFLRVYLNGTLQDTIGLQDYLQDESYYSFKTHPFSYNMTASGKNVWEEYPDVSFTYVLTANGYNGTGCGNYWSLPTYNFDGVVNAKEGLKFIRNGSMTISMPPQNCPENTTWSVQTPEVNVKVTMRKTCGSGMYDNYQTDGSGWISYRELDVENECVPVPATADRVCWIHSFDNSSLSSGFRAYGGPAGWPGGGIYKNGVYQEWNLGQVKWNGKTGYFRINAYDYQATYFIVYLPPNGPLVCAYTGYEEANSSLWTRRKTFDAQARYGSHYQRHWTEPELRSELNFPACPCTGCNCTQTISQYQASEYKDPDSAITFSFDTQTLAVTGTCGLTDFDQNYTETVELADHLEAPPNPGYYTLSVRLFSDGNELASGSRGFSVCGDLDGDGHCEELGDCDDSDPSIKPGAGETCDGKDNDCDGTADEDFYGEGFDCVLGQSCNDWEGSVCSGECVCTQNGLNVTCDSEHSPGELEELCQDGKDNDCDGVVDEVFELVNGTETEACAWRCGEGGKKPCGNDIGFCLPGERTCIGGEWGACIGKRDPRNETCNLGITSVPRYADDDCDGVIDNVYGGTSVEETKCQCYSGNPKKPEECNGIDDDCDGEIDERACSCSEGDTRYCGNDKGICEQGIQRCEGGYWQTECTGGVGPDPSGEICYNNLDDDCDGEKDESCIPEITCSNGVWDLNEDGTDCGGVCTKPCEYPAPWIIVSVVVIIFIIAFIVLELRGKIPV